MIGGSRFFISFRLLPFLVGVFFAFLVFPPVLPAATEQLPAGITGVNLVKPAVVQVRAGATATFRFNNQAWPVAVGGTASGLVVNPNGTTVTAARTLELLTRDRDALRTALIERFFTDVQKQIGHRLAESERIYIAEHTTLLTDVKYYREVVLPGGTAVDFEIAWIGTPTPEILLPENPVPADTQSTTLALISRNPPSRSTSRLGTTNPTGPRFDPVQEVAVIKIPGDNLPAIRLSPLTNGDVSEEATVIGFAGNAEATALLSSPLVTEATIITGKLSPATSGKNESPYGPTTDLAAPLAPAAAGGPVIAGNKVVGLAGPTAKGTGIYPLITTQAIREALVQAQAADQTSQATRLYADTLAMFNQGYVSKTVALLEDFLATNPNHVYAQQLLTEARHRQKAGDDRIYWPDYLIFMIPAVLAPAGFAGLWFYRRRQRRQIPPEPKPIARWHFDLSPPAPPVEPAPEPVTPVIATPVPAPMTSASEEVATTIATTVAEPTIEFLAGPLAGKTFTIPPEGFLIGRDTGTCQLVIPAPVISKQHAYLGPDAFDPATIIITDKGSTNGTFLASPQNSRLNAPYYLQDGDIIYLGQETAFVFHPGCPLTSAQFSRTNK
ncbi:MAG: FHA domain-containing protein [Heliobacteriaceae bacterium]|nr:FHA domain-containing protein [Heliobacteriaceae bacterium]MDD4587277.1 FHA domain-containing protein [Heliobacteriaceae bacterium]